MKQSNSTNIYDLLDVMIANEIGVSTEEYINKIESLDEDVMSYLIMGILEGTPEVKQKAIEEFKSLL